MIKPASFDVIRYKIKMKDIGRFGFNEFTYVPKNGIVNDALPKTITENCCYDIVLEECDRLRNYDWILSNLKQKGYDVSDLKKRKPDDKINFYVFKSKKAKKIFDRKTGGIQGCFQILKEYFIPVSKGAKFYKKTKTNAYDEFAREASLFLYLHEKNKMANAYVKKLLKNLSVKEVDFNPSVKSS